jgi:hypothetical protein
VYLTPSYSKAEKFWEGDLMCIEFGDEPVCKHQVARVIREIYSRFYNMHHKHPIVQRVLKEFQQCNAHCETEKHPTKVEVPPYESAGSRLLTWISSIFARIRKAFSS